MLPFLPKIVCLDLSVHAGKQTGKRIDIARSAVTHIGPCTFCVRDRKIIIPASCRRNYAADCSHVASSELMCPRIVALKWPRNGFPKPSWRPQTNGPIAKLHQPALVVAVNAKTFRRVLLMFLRDVANMICLPWDVTSYLGNYIIRCERHVRNGA